MKVHVSFTVDIDPDAWQRDFGVTSPSEVRQDVRIYVENGARDHLRELGLLHEEN